MNPFTNIPHLINVLIFLISVSAFVAFPLVAIIHFIIEKVNKNKGGRFILE